FRKNHGTPIGLLDMASQFLEFRNGLFGVLSVDQGGTSMPEVEGDRGDAPAQFLFADKFGMVFAQIPDDRRDVEHALVVGHDDQGPSLWNIDLVDKAVAGPQDPGAAHDQIVQDGDAPLVRMISKKLEAQPLNGMEQCQDQSKKKEKNQTEGIGNQFFHGHGLRDAGCKNKKTTRRVV